MLVRGLDMSEIALLRLNSATILVEFMDKHHVDTDAVLARVGLTREAFSSGDDVFVPALILYQICEDAAVATDDPGFLARLGEAVDLATWPPMIAASSKSSDIGQLLMRFAIEATEHSSAVRESLEVHGERAVFHGYRSFAPAFVPGQIDGFYAGLILSILRRTLGRQWNPSEVVLTVSDPKALPPFYFGIRALKGDRHGYRIAFPARWLAVEFDSASLEERLSNEEWHGFPARTAAASVAQAVQVHIGQIPLTSKLAAEFCGKSERALSRILEKEGTSLGQVLNNLKRDYAKRMLRESDTPILDIATALGYKAPTSFTRSFKEWVGQTPSEFRASAGKR